MHGGEDVLRHAPAHAKRAALAAAAAGGTGAGEYGAALPASITVKLATSIHLQTYEETPEEKERFER